jgi:mannose-6-phosphate isomerase-like protein (cupin superfamily)
MDGASPTASPQGTIWLGGGVEAVFRIAGPVTGGRLSVVEHPMAPGSLIEPHTHHREDEYSYVLSGTLGMLLGDREFEATPGMMVVKPSGVPHAAWNSGPEPARFLEIISPAGFERFFTEVAELFSGDTDPEADEFERLAAAYGLSFHMELVNDLIERHGLTAAARYT